MKIELQFMGGESCYHPGKACNYIFVKLPDDEELYAETLIPDGCEDECYGYSALKAEIIRQAENMGIPAETLVFPYDD